MTTTTKKGIDVSYCNPDVNYAKVKASGIDFVIIRTGYLQKTDTEFYDHIKAATAAGLNVGVYCYCMANSTETAVAEAKHVLQLIKPYKLTYPVFYDMEDNRLTGNATERSLIAIAFCETIRKGGYYPALYINPAWLEMRVDKSRLSAYDIWLAAWTDSASKATKYKYGQTMWQWGTDTVSGVSGPVDADLCYIDYPEKIRKAGLNGLAAVEKLIDCKTVCALRIRVAPTIRSTSMAVLPKGTTIQAVAGSETDADGYTWVKVKRGSTYGWCAKSDNDMAINYITEI